MSFKLQKLEERVLLDASLMYMLTGIDVMALGAMDGLMDMGADFSFESGDHMEGLDQSKSKETGSETEKTEKQEKSQSQEPCKKESYKKDQDHAQMQEFFEEKQSEEHKAEKSCNLAIAKDALLKAEQSIEDSAQQTDLDKMHREILDLATGGLEDSTNFLHKKVRSFLSS